MKYLYEPADTKSTGLSGVVKDLSNNLALQYKIFECKPTENSNTPFSLFLCILNNRWKYLTINQ